MVLHYVVVLYTRLAPYRDYFLHLSYANFYVKARKIYNFCGGGGVGFQKSPPAGSDSALRATQGQSRLLKALTSRQKLYVPEEKGLRGTQAVKSFLESLYSFSKNFMRERGRATQGQSQLLAVPIASPKTLGVRGERPLFYFLIKFSCIYAMLKRYFQSVS